MQTKIELSSGCIDRRAGFDHCMKCLPPREVQKQVAWGSIIFDGGKLLRNVTATGYFFVRELRCLLPVAGAHPYSCHGCALILFRDFGAI